MNQTERFYNAIKNEMTVILATGVPGSVTMREVSPVYYNGAVLIFTGKASKKYLQLTENPHCCICAGGFFAEADAEFRGETMKPENAALREVYTAKFPGAFAEGVEFGGRNSNFILLHPTKLSGWTFSGGTPTPGGIPDMPFEIQL